MTNNLSQPNTTGTGCDANWDVLLQWQFYSIILCSVASFAGNFLIIFTVCLTKTMRTTTNYFVVNMAVSDIIVPATYLLSFFVRAANYAAVVILNTSYGVSMSSLVVITVHRFYAVAFPMRARLESRSTRITLLFFTWLLPVAVCCPLIYYYQYVGTAHFLIWLIIFVVVFVALPFLFMLVLYPVIIIKLVRQKAPGNSSSRSQVRRRREQNVRLTNMLITIILAYLLTYGVYLVSLYGNNTSDESDLCTWNKMFLIVYPFPIIFDIINPVIFFIFCSSYRQGLKQIFSCCFPQSTVRRNPPGGGQIELQNGSQQLKYPSTISTYL